MDPGSIAGIGIAFVAIFGSMVMEGGNPAAIISPPALVLVLGGTFGAAMASGMMRDATGIVRWVKTALLTPKMPPDDAVPVVVSLAEKARREGLLALEEAAAEVHDPFLREGLQLAIDGTDPEELRDILECKIAAKRADDKAGAKLFTDMGGYAPTIGIIGTVLGLVHVLENLSQPDKLGHLIAGAFIATLWGVMTANILWLPMGNKIKRLSELQAHRMELVVEGVLSIQAGMNPRLVQLKLESLLPPGEGVPAEKAA